MNREMEINREESKDFIFSLCSDIPYEKEDDVGKYDEVLVISEDSIDFSRLNSGACAFLKDHDPENVLGVITKAWIDGNKVKCKVKFSEREEVQAIVKDVKDGVMTCTSIGYEILQKHFETVNGKRTLYADRYLIYEGSLVGVPADITCGYNRAAVFKNTEGVEMKKSKKEIEFTDEELKKLKELLAKEEEADEEAAVESAAETAKEEAAQEIEEEAAEEAVEAAAAEAAAKPDEETAEEKECGEDKIEEKECGEEEEIRSLGELVNKRALAEKYIKAKRSLKDFKRALRQHEETLNVKGKNMEKTFSLRKALLNAVGKMSNEEASYEREVIAENKRKFGVTDGDIVLSKKEIRAFNGAEALNQVVYQPGLYAAPLRPPVTVDAIGTKTVAVQGPSISFSVATSGLNAGYVNINNEIPSATMEFSLKTMTPKKYGCYVDVSYQSLLQDDPSAEAVIMEDITKALDQAKDYAFWNGTAGNNQPVGLLETSGVKTVTLGDTPALSTALAFEKEIRDSFDYSGDLKWVFGTGAYYTWASTPYSEYAAENKMLLDPDTRKCIGYDCFMDPNLPTSAVILGDFNEALQANFDGITIKIVEDAALARKQAIEIVAYAANDYCFRRPGVFVKGE